MRTDDYMNDYAARARMSSGEIRVLKVSADCVVGAINDLISNPKVVEILSVKNVTDLAWEEMLSFANAT
jgi:hypothetical protein